MLKLPLYDGIIDLLPYRLTAHQPTLRPTPDYYPVVVMYCEIYRARSIYEQVEPRRHFVKTW